MYKQKSSQRNFHKKNPSSMYQFNHTFNLKKKQNEKKRKSDEFNFFYQKYLI